MLLLLFARIVILPLLGMKLLVTEHTFYGFVEDISEKRNKGEELYTTS
jgi:hypothetical protein